jgi:hypothetical protein
MDLKQCAIEFIDESLKAVSKALESGDSSTLQEELEVAVASFSDAIGEEEAGEGELDTPDLPTTAKSFGIIKADDTEHMIWGWGSVVTVAGEPVVDRQLDVIEVPELKKAVYDFMSNHRVGGERHQIMGVGEVVESIVFTNELQKALGIDLGQEGWFVGVHVDNPKTWAKVQSGELRSFSIGGSAERHEVLA